MFRSIAVFEKTLHSKPKITLFNRNYRKIENKGPSNQSRPGVVALLSPRSHANYCNPSNLEQHFTLILLIFTRNIISEKLKFYAKKQKLANLKKLLKTPHFTPELTKLYKHKKTVS